MPGVIDRVFLLWLSNDPAILTERSMSVLKGLFTLLFPRMFYDAWCEGRLCAFRQSACVKACMYINNMDGHVVYGVLIIMMYDVFVKNRN